MKRKLQALLLCLVIMLGCATPAFARPLDTWYIEDRAQALYEMGLMKGTGINSDETPDFALAKSATRAEGVVMLVRLLGKENEALSGNYSHPFVDVPAWADPYIAYAYTNKLTYGVSSTEFNPGAPMAINQYATLLLRALGYSSEIDFSYMEADTFAADILSYDIFPEDADTTGLEWKSANEQVATVTGDGEILGIVHGNTNIYVTYKNQRMATCDITVRPKPAYERLSDKERKFVDAALEYIDSFKSPESVVIKAIEPKGGDDWYIRLSAKNGFGGVTDSVYFLMNGYLKWGFVDMDNTSMTPDNSYHIELINEAIQDKL